MSLAGSLKKETKKWTRKIEKEMADTKITGKNASFVANIKAYVKDSKHFAKKGDLIRSFETIIWAWAWLEILKELGMIK
jgi:hypothetical protein